MRAGIRMHTFSDSRIMLGGHAVGAAFASTFGLCAGDPVGRKPDPKIPVSGLMPRCPDVWHLVRTVHGNGALLF